MSAILGTRISGRYRLDARCGTGGMSTVYRAFDLTLERPVALKLMNREIADDADQLERFRREARAVAQLSDPHIVTVIDAGEDDGRPYIVFEFVAGETLKERIRNRGPRPIVEAVAYAIEVARALGAAHARGIVHRDVKPQNVLIDEEGSAKVTDFGIARSRGEEGLTREGRVLGTTDYVSPEQALGHPVTGQSDLYSLGIVLYEMLTGDVPFHGENQVAVAMKHVRDEIPDVQARRPDCSAALAAVVERATAKELDSRYPAAQAMIADLEDVLTIETARAGSVTGEATTVLRTLPGGKRRRVPLRLRTRPPLAALLGALAVAAGAGLVWFLSQNTHHGVGAPPEGPPARGLHAVVLRQDAAHDYDPFGRPDHHEHPEQAAFAVDALESTSWTTESYRGGVLNKPGVGLYIDAAPSTPAAVLQVLTTTPGLDLTVYGARSGPPPSVPGGWTRLGARRSIPARARIRLSSGSTPYRYFLVWITRLEPGHTTASISEISLFRR